MLFRFFRYFAFACLISSCLKMSETEQRENMLEEPTLSHSVEKSLQSPYFSIGAWPDVRWWETFGSAKLNQLIAEALEKNPTIQNVRMRIELAKQKAISARSKLYPLVYFVGDGTWEFVSKQGLEEAYNPAFPRHAHIIDLTLTFDYEFDFWDKYRNLYRAALGREEAEKAELAQAELITATSLARIYFALTTNQIKKVIYRNLYEVRRKIALLRQLLLDEAIDDMRIVLLANERAERAQQWCNSIEEELEIDRHMLNVLIGKGPDEAIEVDAKLVILPEKLAIPKTVSLDLLSRRPDLMAQLWRLEALAHDVGAARANFFPNINLSALLGLSSTIYNMLFNQSSYEQGITPTISLPIYTAGDIQATLDAKRAEYQSAVFVYNDMILKSVSEVADALSVAKAVYANRVQQDAIVGCAAKRLGLANDRLKSGLDNALETLHKQEELLEAQLAQMDFEYSQYAAAISLIRALGGGYEAAHE